MKIIGHRGARGLAEENTIPSIKRALACKVDMVEVDLRVQDTTIVLSHDPLLKNKKYTTLQEMLALVNGKTPINLEIKEAGVVPLLKKELKNYRGPIVFSSFEYKILHPLRVTFPRAQIAVLEKWSAVRAVSEASLIHTKRIHLKQEWLWSGVIRSLKHHGYEVYGYTVNSRDRAEELEAWGIDGIFTDYPSLFRQ